MSPFFQLPNQESKQELIFFPTSISLDSDNYVNISYNVGDNRSYFLKLHLDIINVSLYNKENIDFLVNLNINLNYYIELVRNIRKLLGFSTKRKDYYKFGNVNEVFTPSDKIKGKKNKIKTKQTGGDYIDDKLAEIKSSLRKGDIIDFCRKYVDYQKGIGNTVSMQDCYQKQLTGEDVNEDRVIDEIDVRKALLDFAEKNNTKENNPVFHARLIKLIENLGDNTTPLSRKLITFLIDIGEMDNQPTSDTSLNGGKNKKTKKKKRKSTKKTKKKKRKLTKKKRKSNKKAPPSKCTLYYFTMNGCPYCEDFDPTWEKLTKSFPEITMEKLNENNNNHLIQKYKVIEFPTVILNKQNKPIHYKKEKNIEMLSKFLKKNINMV
tara:strand:- start:963 stop:2099 length:1137 start_codon:yes stop_codon:yes gene_type:complete